MAITIIVTPGEAEFRAILDSYTAKPDPDNPRPEYVTLMRWLLGEATEDELLKTDLEIIAVGHRAHASCNLGHPRQTPVHVRASAAAVRARAALATTPRSGTAAAAAKEGG